MSALYIPEKFINQCLNEFGNTDNVDQRQLLEEECAELIQAISKNIRNKPGSIDKIKEEMTHVLISVNVVANILGISQDDILNELHNKCCEYDWDANKLLYVQQGD